MKELSKSWMEGEPEEAGYLYVDGHVRVYHGELATLPRRFVSRERLCLRGTTAYWVNDALGRPFCQLWEQRIGALTYRKNVNDVRPEAEFVEQEVLAPGGERSPV